MIGSRTMGTESFRDRARTQIPGRGISQPWLLSLVLLLTGSLSVVAQEDEFEPDNLQSNATEILVDGTVQIHTLHSIRDSDWIFFNTVPGTLYLVNFSGAGSNPVPVADTAIRGGYVPPEQNILSGYFDEDLYRNRLAISANSDKVYVRYSPHGATGTYSVSVIPVERETVAVTSKITVFPPTVKYGNTPSGSGTIYGGGEGPVEYRWVTILPDGSTVKSELLQATMKLTTGKAKISPYAGFPAEEDGNYLTYVEIASLDTVQSNARPYAIFGRGEATAVAAPAVITPVDALLLSNFPNPFNDGTVIPFQLDQRGTVELFVYNLAGQRVASLVDEVRGPGAYSVHWNGRDERGRTLASGVYLYRLQTDGQVQTRKLAISR